MEAASLLNLSIQQKYSKDKKVGEGTYAVVYLGRELATGRKIAIKKVSQPPPLCAPSLSPSLILVREPRRSKSDNSKMDST